MTATKQVMFESALVLAASMLTHLSGSLVPAVIATAVALVAHFGLKAIGQ